MTDLSLTSPVFEDGDRIPDEYGYTERNVNPALEIDGVPADTRSLALVVDDPDAVEPAGKVWDHWIVWNIDPAQKHIPKDYTPTGATEGRNDYDEFGYGGPNPPDKEHTYVFTLYALEVEIDLESGATKADLEAAIDGHVLETARIKGTYAP